MSPRRSFMGAYARATLVLAVLAGGASCKAAPGAERAQEGACACASASAAAAAGAATGGTAAGAPLAVPVLAWLSKARSLHHAADVAEDEGAADRAIRLLEELATGPRPEGSPEIDEVLADTAARLADLRSRGGAFEEAARDVERGLGLAREPSYFRGHLYEVLGLVRQREAAALAKQGRAADAERARSDAIRASLEAVRLQNGVIERALADAGRERDQ